MQNKMYLEKITSEDDFEYVEKLSLNEKVMTMNYGRVFTPDDNSSVDILGRKIEHIK